MKYINSNPFLCGVARVGVANQVQAIYMYGAAQPDFLKSETNGGIKNIISHHLKIIKRCVFSPNLEGVAQKISLPRPWEV